MRCAHPALLAVLLLAVPQAPGFAAVSLYMPPEEVAARAVMALEGTVTSVASGYDPETGRLATYVTLQPSFVHRGPRTLGTVVVREPGGRYGTLVHELDAVPVYQAGEEVFVFLEAAPDGALRTAGRFFGKYTLHPGATRDGDRAVRDLSGQGTILRRPVDGEMEEIPVRDLAAAVAGLPVPAVRGGWAPVPPEYGRVLWDTGSEPAGSAGLAGTGSSGVDVLSAAGPGGAPGPNFAPLSSSSPTRWTEPDTGATVLVAIEPDRNPLNDPAGAVAEMKRAMAAWSGVPESRIVLQSGNDDDDFTGTNASSPADVYPPRNIILFGDPYADITDPSGCSGTLAIGGYWRNGTISSTVNNTSFYKAQRLYVIFNNNFECFLGNKDNLAEVATHELGHGLGFGHSTIADAIMRSSAYGNGRGPRLGNDDRDGSHCHYPHALTLTSPNGGESWTAGALHPITWTATAESGGDPGVVSLEWSSNSGATWSTLVSGTANDGSWTWTVPSSAGTAHQVRVIRPNLVSPTPAPYPSACSLDASNGTFTITAGAPPSAGTSSATLQVSESSGTLTVTWGASCSTGATDYALYQGSLATLRSGSWDHAAVTCAGGTDLSHTFTPASGDRYYLAAPLAGGSEGRLGRSSSGADRPAAASACAPREGSSCP